jgi:hypothetical protein
MVGPSKSSLRPISRTNVRMHANADIWEIRQIEATKEAKVMMGTMDLVTRTMDLVTQTRAAMEVEGRTAVMAAVAAVATWRKMTILMTTRAITKATVPMPATRTISMSMMICTRTRMSEQYT